MALDATKIKEAQSWFGTTPDGIWGRKSTEAAGGRSATSAYSFYSSNKGRYATYKDYLSSGSSSGGGLSTEQIKEMQSYYGTTPDGIWGRKSTAAAGGKSAQDAWDDYQSRRGSGMDNGGGLSTEQIKELQSYYGTTPDGIWGRKSTAAAGGKSAQDAWNDYQSRQSGAEDSGSGYDTPEDTGTGTDPASFSDFLHRVGGDEYEAAVQSAIAAQVQATTDEYNQQIEDAKKTYEENARRAYISKMMGQRNMDQELAANGVYGGMADSQRIASETNYENNLADMKNQFDSTVSALQQAITSAKLAGDAQSAQAMASYLSQVQSQYVSWLMDNGLLDAQQGTAGGSSGGNSSTGYDEEVAALQRELNAKGADLVVDGIMGPKTQAARDQYGDSGYTVTNRNGKGWIALDGGGRYSYAEIQQMLDDGQVKEVVNDRNKTISYVRVR